MQVVAYKRLEQENQHFSRKIVFVLTLALGRERKTLIFFENSNDSFWVRTIRQLVVAITFQNSSFAHSTLVCSSLFAKHYF